MKISVIVPTYKPKAYLWECLNSLCNQSFHFEDYEIIIVLNGCKEPYDSQINEFIHLHNKQNWRYFQTDESGVSNARNIALRISTGDYIAFVDDDDYVSPNYLEELYAVSNPETIAISNVQAFEDSKPNEKIPYFVSDAFDTYSQRGKTDAGNVRKFFSSTCMKLISRDIIHGRTFDTRFKNSEDSLFMFQISDKIKYLNFTSASAIYYRRYRENSALMARKSKTSVIGNSIKVIGVYTCTYFRHPLQYSFKRYIMAVLGMFHYIIVNVK